MQSTSQLVHQNQTIIPEAVLQALKLREGDAIVFEIDQAGAHLRKAPPIRTRGWMYWHHLFSAFLQQYGQVIRVASGGHQIYLVDSVTNQS